MSIFFNGRVVVSPAVMTAVNDAAMLNQGLSVGNVLAVLGTSLGGTPNTELRFGSAAEAKAVLVDGPLLDCVQRAFDPSADTGGPATVIGIRVNPATQATLDLADSTSTTVINLASTDYGLRNNQIKVKIEAPSNRGRKITTQFGNDYYSQDDIHRDAFSVSYGGAQASARMTVSNTQITLEAPNSSVVATILLSSYDTIQEVVDRINTVAGFSATVLDGNGDKPSLNALDTVSNQDVKTAPYTATADLQAIVDWFNDVGEGFVTATRAAGAGKMPATNPFTYLSGGSEGSTTNSEWSAGFTTLQNSDVQWVVPASTDPAIHAMADAHCAYMSNVARKERRAICGTPLGTSDTAAIALAKNINSDRTSLTHLGGYDYNAAGRMTLYPPYVVAAMIAGGFSGVNPGTPMTNKSLKLRGMERKLRNPTDTDALILGGILCVEADSTGYRVVKSISTWLTNTNFNRVEISTGVALDYVLRSVRVALAPLKGARGDPSVLARAVAITETTLRELAKPDPVGIGVIVGDADSPAYLGIKAQLDGDQLAVQFHCSPVIPVNYIPVTVYAQPYSGSASA